MFLDETSIKFNMSDNFYSRIMHNISEIDFIKPVRYINVRLV